MRTHVIVGVDGSENSLIAADWAAREAASREVPLRVLHARPLLPLLLPGRPWAPPKETADLLHTVESILVRAHPGLEVSCVEVVDTAPSALVAASEEADLLVVGARGRGGFAELLLGSVGLHSAARAHCPVMTVRQSRTEALAEPHQPEILLGVNARAPDEAALRFAFETAQRRGAGLRAVHAYPPPGPLGAEDDEQAEDECALLEEALAICRKQYPDVDLRAQTVAADPACVLVHAASSAELVVIGRREPAGSLHPRLGHVAHVVLHHAPCTVAVVPQT
jgi:nucleotide-binding universal stress UspA family protein